MPRPFTDAELRQVAEHVTYHYLEVERGLRSKQTLRRLLSPEAYSQQHDPAASRFGAGGIVGQGDIGQMIFQRDGDAVHAAVPTRQGDDRWGALLIEMRSNGRDVWRVTELTRAQDRNLTRPHPVPDRMTPAEPDRDVQQAVLTLGAAQIAQSAAQQRHTRALADLARLAPEKPPGDLRPGDILRTDTTPASHWVQIRSAAAQPDGDVRITTTDGASLVLPGDRGVPTLTSTFDAQPGQNLQAAEDAARTLAGTAEELSHWTRRVADLEDDRDQLIGRRDAYARLNRGAEPQPAAYLTHTLGQRPADGQARPIWDAAAAAIEGYRDRWDITDERTALGARPDDPDQRADRHDTVTALRDLTGRLADCEPDPLGSARSPGREDVARDPFDLTPPGAQR
jgi:hypothetical protein